MKHPAFVPAALALALTASPAMAARQITPPISGYGFSRCMANYVGPTAGVQITAVMAQKSLQTSVTRTFTQSFNMGPANRVQVLERQCQNTAAVNMCDLVTCTFTFSVPTADVATSAAVWVWNGGQGWDHIAGR